jgi:thioesterase domain-containing protein
MLPAELEQYMHRTIPLSRAMAVAVVSVAESAVTLQAPLAPNINHRDTVFGGSACALAILAGWSLLYLRLQAAGVTGSLVIQRNTMEYQQPIMGPFTARAELEHPERWQSFATLLARRGKARVTVTAVLEHAQQVAGRFSGEFVALAAPRGTGRDDGGR